MATRPWVTPADVKGYTELSKVSAREDGKMVYDITRAESYLIDRFGNAFDELNADGSAKYPTIPDDVKLAVILVTEVYSYNAMLDPEKAAMKSETYDDYTYTKEADAMLSVDALDLETLMSQYVIASGRGTVFMRATIL